MSDITVTDWMSAIGTVFAALITAPAAVYAAVYTRRAAAAAAKAAEEAANQVNELRVGREPRAVLKVRVPEPFNTASYISYGRGNNRYRTGPPVYLDVWNVSGPTIMVMKVALGLDGSGQNEEELCLAPLTPQVLVESGKVASINVAYQLLGRVTQTVDKEDELINFPDRTRTKASFRVEYFSVEGNQFAEVACNFQFRVTEENLISWVID